MMQDMSKKRSKVRFQNEVDLIKVHYKKQSRGQSLTCLDMFNGRRHLRKRSAAGRIKNDLYCGFTEWLRDLAVNLENKPLLSAVEDTYDSCPVIMKESLGKFIYEIELNPSDIMPYYSFLSEFDVMDIQSAVRMLYSIGDLDRDSMNQTINALVRRNYELSDKAEAARYLDSTSMMRFSEYIPTFFVAFKMAVDMMLVVNMYL